MCSLTNYRIFHIYVAAATIIVHYTSIEFCIKVAKHGYEMVITPMWPCQNYGHCERNAASGDYETCILVTLSAVKNTTRDTLEHLRKQRGSELLRTGATSTQWPRRTAVVSLHSKSCSLIVASCRLDEASSASVIDSPSFRSDNWKNTSSSQQKSPR